MTPDECRRERESLHWTTNELAIKAGLSHPTIVAFEAGRRQPREQSLIAIRKALRAARS